MTGPFSALYFAVQRLRHGVRPEQVDAAARLLEAEEREVQDHVSRRLAAVHHLSTSPLDWLKDQPLTGRGALRETMAQGQGFPAGTRFERRKTSGSTGTPTSLVKDLAMAAQMDATMWAVYRWHGLGPGQRHARFWGRPLAPLARAQQQTKDFFMNRRRLGAFSLSRENAIRFFHTLRRFRPFYAYGYPTLIRHFLDLCREEGLEGRDLGFKVLISTGELLSDQNRTLFQEFFDCRVVNEYGCTESGVLGFECEAGGMHSIPTAAFMEILCGDGLPAPAGEAGEVVVTDLYGDILPLVRHRLRDRGRFLEEPCSCGRGLPLIRVDMGRVDSFINTPGKGPVYDAILAYTIPRTVQRFRAYQVAPDQLTVQVVPGPGFDPGETPERCRGRWEKALGPGMTVTIEVVDHIPYEASGKLRYFVPMDGD